MTSIRLVEARERLWAEMAEDYGLLPQLAADAILARVTAGPDSGPASDPDSDPDSDPASGPGAETMVVAAPRLIELVTGQQASVEEASVIVEVLGATPWADHQRPLVVEPLDAWWQQTLMMPQGEHDPPWTPDTVLGVLVGFGAPMVRWFEPWLVQLDGHGAAHLATIVLHGLDGPAWAGKSDQAGQVLGWARTETVVNGLILIGGVHLDDDVLSDVLDALI